MTWNKSFIRCLKSLNSHACLNKFIQSMIVMMMAVTINTQPVFAENAITGIRTGSVVIDGGDAARLVVETQDVADINMFLLSDPYRLVIDFPSLKWRASGKGASGALQTPPLRSFRYGAPKPGVSRLVIEMAGPAAPVRVFRLPPNDRGHRLVVDMLDRGETAFRVASQAFKNNTQSPLALALEQPAKTGDVMLMPIKRPQQKSQISPKKWPNRDKNGLLLPWPKPREIIQLARSNAKGYTDINISHSDKWIVFIDAGHGGKDPGAIGISGLYEKDVTLSAAKELAKQLNATGRVRAVLSRDHDVYHKLRKRINLARQKKADVFISLHADAAENKKARGVSVFTLSEKASDKEAALLAKRENKADLIGGPDLGTTDPQVSTALLSMFQRESMNQSSVLAKYIINEFTGLPTPKRGHRFAGFAVLKSPDVPSVLIEMGFLTNSRDEKNLKSTAYRRDLMTRVKKAVMRYLDDLPSGPITQ